MCSPFLPTSNMDYFSEENKRRAKEWTSRRVVVYPKGILGITGSWHYSQVRILSELPGPDYLPKRFPGEVQGRCSSSNHPMGPTVRRGLVVCSADF